MIPFLQLKPGEDAAAVGDAIARVIARGWFILGPELEAFEREFAAASGAADAGSLAAIAKAKGMTAKDQKNFVLGSPLGEGPTAGTNEELENALFAMKAGEVSKKPVKIGESLYIVGVNKREDADTTEFAKQRSGLMEQMLSKKRSAVITDYLAAAKQKLQNAGDIKIYQEALDKIDAPEPGAPAPDDNGT